eukprot:gene402-3748_t
MIANSPIEIGAGLKSTLDVACSVPPWFRGSIDRLGLVPDHPSRNPANRESLSTSTNDRKFIRRESSSSTK